MTHSEEIAAVVAKLTKAQRAMLLASEPGGWGRADTACGVELRGSDYRVARALSALGVGTYSHGSPYGDLYFNNANGIAVRQALLNQGEG